MERELILGAARLGFPWPTPDPFLFCVYHNDAYPRGNAALGPDAPLDGRNLGQDFEGRDGWRMYHGREVPGFPQHPHRGFETVTIVRRGFVDHSDSLGATARYGQGDVQWLTAGRGINHCEMFPLLRPDADNPLELFQIWLNLPRADKFADPHFTMFWGDRIPSAVVRDEAGRASHINVVAGAFPDVGAPPAPPPHSWASRAESDVAIWTLKLDPGATVTLPPARPGTNRRLYFFAGASIVVGGALLDQHAAVDLRADLPAPLVNGPAASELLVLQGRPIGEPVAQYGPFVMNSEAEVRQAFADYRRTQFGGWPWPSDAPVHPVDAGRFAVHADGRTERP